MNILIVDDHPLTCQGLSALLTATKPQATICSVYTAAQAREALAASPGPEWIFLDITLPDDPNHQLFQWLITTRWIDRTIIISADVGHGLVRTALASGARGFIPKIAEPQVVLEGFESILSGNFYVPESMARLLREEANQEGNIRPLSPRLLQVQDMLSRGSPNKVIARDLRLSAHTVKEYVSSVLTYHGVTNRLDLVLKLKSRDIN